MCYRVAIESEIMQVWALFLLVWVAQVDWSGESLRRVVHHPIDTLLKWKRGASVRVRAPGLGSDLGSVVPRRGHRRTGRNEFGLRCLRKRSHSRSDLGSDLGSGNFLLRQSMGVSIVFKAVTVDGDVGASHSLADEVGYDSPVVWVHVWAVSVEDPDDFDVGAVHAVVKTISNFDVTKAYIGRVSHHRSYCQSQDRENRVREMTAGLHRL